MSSRTSLEQTIKVFYDRFCYLSKFATVGWTDFESRQVTQRLTTAPQIGSSAVFAVNK